MNFESKSIMGVTQARNIYPIDGTRTPAPICRQDARPVSAHFVSRDARHAFVHQISGIGTANTFFDALFYARSKRSTSIRDISTKASMDGTNYPEEQKARFSKKQLSFLFKQNFEILLAKHQYISPLPEQEHEFSSINYDTDLLAVRQEWQEAFLIARGQTFAEMISNQIAIECGGSDNSSKTIMLLRDASTKMHEVSYENLLPTVADMLKQYPNQEVVAYISMNKNLDSSTTCFKVSEKLSGQNAQKLQKKHYWQKLQQLNDFLKDRKEALKKQLDFLYLNNEARFLQQQDKVKLRQDIIDVIKRQETELLQLQREERAELKRYQSYYMLLSTPDVRNIVDNLSKIGRLDHIMLIESNEHSLDSEAPRFAVRLVFKRLPADDYLGRVQTDQLARQQQFFKQIFSQVLAEHETYSQLSEKYSTELSSMNTDTRVFDLPAECQKAFLIARGQAYERARAAGTSIAHSPYRTLLPENSNLALHLASSDHRQWLTPKSHLPAALAEIFKQKPHEHVIISTTTDVHDPDSRFTCKIVGEDLNLQKRQMIKKNLYQQKRQEWLSLRERQDQQELHMLQGRQNSSKDQFLLVLKELQNKLKSTQQVLYLQQDLDEIKDMLEYVITEKIDQLILEAAHKKDELLTAQKLSDAYDMLLGTPKVQSILASLSTQYIIDSVAIEPLSASVATESPSEQSAADAKMTSSRTQLANGDYRISLSLSSPDHDAKR